jgi:hypothetical protein
MRQRTDNRELKGNTNRRFHVNSVVKNFFGIPLCNTLDLQHNLGATSARIP